MWPRSWWLFLVVVTIAHPTKTASAQPADAGSQARRVVEARIPPADVNQQLTLTDGSRVYGRLESVTSDAIVFRSISGIVLTVTRTEVADLREVRGDVVNGEFQPADPHNTRLFFAPTARMLKRGEGYLGIYEVVVPFVQVGITDRLSVGAGTPFFFGGDFHPVWVTPKVQLLAREGAQVAAGVIHITGVDKSHDVGIAYGVTTLGPGEKAVTVGLGYGYSGEGGAPIVMVGGEYRTSRRVKFITENWIWGGGNGLVSGGVRFLGDHLSADLGLIVPLAAHAVPFPIVSFAWHF